MTDTKHFDLKEQCTELYFFLPGTPQLTVRPPLEGEEPHVEVQGPVDKLEQLYLEQVETWSTFLYLPESVADPDAGALSWGKRLQQRISNGEKPPAHSTTTTREQRQPYITGYDIKTLADEPIILNSAATDSPFVITVVIRPTRLGFRRRLKAHSDWVQRTTSHPQVARQEETDCVAKGDAAAAGDN